MLRKRTNQEVKFQFMSQKFNNWMKILLQLKRMWSVKLLFIYSVIYWRSMKRNSHILLLNSKSNFESWDNFEFLITLCRITNQCKNIFRIWKSGWSNRWIRKDKQLIFWQMKEKEWSHSKARLLKRILIFLRKIIKLCFLKSSWKDLHQSWIKWNKKIWK